MPSPSLWCARHRVGIALPFVALLTLIAQPASAAGDPQNQVDTANQQLHAAQAQASAEDSALAFAQQMLVRSQAQLTALQQRITALDATVTADAATVHTLDAQLTEDRNRLSSYLRDTYEQGGSQAALVYLISAGSISDVIERKEQLDHVATAVQQLVTTIHAETQRATATLADDNAAKVQLSATEAQARTQAAVIAVQEEQVQGADLAAHQQVAAAQHQVSAAEAALAAARASNTVYPSVSGGLFSVDTNLRLPSGETAARINAFLANTDMAGLGQSFMNAESRFHVSARYFVAHAILESDWGASAIAQDKHNLFGFNANDSNPYGDASSFSSFDACIQYVAQFIASNYLSASGPFYHGPTLRGMNVDYATDPGWAFKIAAIASTIP